MSRIIGALYALAGLFLVLAWTTPWMVERSVPTAWGYGAVPGRAFPIYYVITIAAAGTALYRWIRHLQSTPERIRSWKGWLATIGLMSPMVAASLTDGILPTLGVHPPRIGTVSVAALVGSLVPMGFARINIDPAVATGPFVTTAIDIISVFFYFKIATALLGI